MLEHRNRNPKGYYPGFKESPGQPMPREKLGQKPGISRPRTEK